MNPPFLLRAPPFPGRESAMPVSDPPPAPIAGGAERAALFEKIRQARVGGDFWSPPALLSQPPGAVFRPRSLSDVRALLPLVREAEGESMLWETHDAALLRLLSRMGAGRTLGMADVDPWSVLCGASVLHAHGDDEWVALARIAGVSVTVLSPGPYGKPEDSPDALDRRAAAALAPMADPFGAGWLTMERSVALLADWRRMLDANRGETGETIVAACGIAWWKRAEIRRFLWTPGERLRIVSSPRRAVSVAAKAGGALAVWPSRVSPALLAAARDKGVPLVRVEDGFVRSVGLGSNLVPPSSIIVDRRGIHFDPSGPSALEDLLAGAEFSKELLGRARALAKTILSAGISKYAAGRGDTALPKRTDGRRIVLVPGQVEDDMSVLAGGGGLTSNLELLRRVRALEPEAEIWWRPHPDVDAGHRLGTVPDEQALRHADRIMRGGSMAALLDHVDAVHVLTSLTGFEALMRGREVVCHGTPFYAGWGLTRDLAPVPLRRGRRLDIDQLVAGVLILYPRYLDPVTGLPCPPETLVARMARDSAVNRQGWIGPLRRWQGRVMTRVRKLGSIAQ